MADRHARSGSPGSDPMVGRLLDGRYRIGPRIARGGMASVYEATDIRLDRTVAVKVMHPGLGDDTDVAQRFVREARAAARLNHPHVVGVFDQGDEDGTVYLAMEYVPGHTLRDVVRKEAPMAPQRALALLEPVVSALAAAHRAGLVHRDVKPENVLIADAQHGGGVKVADFGLARAVSADTQHTATGGVLIGTVSYLAPELVVDGRSDARADVYAAGILLYELLTGRKPHEGESPIQVAYRHVNADVPAPSVLQPGVPGYVDALVARATARDHTLRPADAGVLLHQMHRVAQALRDGLTEDEELTADLAPLVRAGDTTEIPHRVRSGAGRLERSVEGPPDAGEHTTAVPVLVQDPPRRTPPERPASVTQAPRQRSLRGPLVVLLAVLLVAGVGVGAWWFGWARYTMTPGVVGVDRVTAVERLDAEGLEAEVADPQYSETVPKGEVLRSDPEPGQRVLDGGTVTLVLSLGPERYDVPKVAGRSEDRAQDLLLGTHLSVGDPIEKWSEKVPEGTVLGSRPRPGTSLRPDSAVQLVVSKGPRPRQVPDVAGTSLEQAQQQLRRRGLVPEVVAEEYSDTVSQGDVISQSPADGTLYRGDSVELVVSQGPELVEVPRV
ncbi:MAG TPA: Stk1 family PASTA domain-containing Ser/Thr kinase, partial [Nocardioides sp.]